MMSEEAGESVNKFLKASVTSVVKFQVAELIDIRFLPMILCRAKVVIPSIILSCIKYPFGKIENGLVSGRLKVS